MGVLSFVYHVRTRQKSGNSALHAQQKGASSHVSGRGADNSGTAFLTLGVLMQTSSITLVGDCRGIVPNLDQKFQFVFADPPFNIGYKYSKYVDKRDDYDEFTEQWITCCWGACEGVMALHGPDDLAEMYLAVARKIGMKRIAWVNWHYRFGQCGRSNWIDARCHCLIFARDSYTWNPEAVLVESDRVKYGDKRVGDTDRGGMRLPGTVWGVPSDGKYWGRVTGNSAERRPKHSNQLPEVYLERLIKAYTNAGDWILDPFCGSGTTATVAKVLERNCITMDVSGESVISAMDRIKHGAVRVKK